jgi:hypothetical protein
MRLGRGPAVAFLLGAAVAIVMIYPTGLPALLTTALMCLCPGYWVGIPLLGLIGPMRLDLGAIPVRAATVGLQPHCSKPSWFVGG